MDGMTGVDASVGRSRASVVGYIRQLERLEAMQVDLDRFRGVAAVADVVPVEGELLRVMKEYWCEVRQAMEFVREVRGENYPEELREMWLWLWDVVKASEWVSELGWAGSAIGTMIVDVHRVEGLIKLRHAAQRFFAALRLYWSE